MSQWHVIDHEGCYIGTPNGVLPITSLEPEDAHAIVNAHNADVAPTAQSVIGKLFSESEGAI
jgi:hypothetical protein